jgi:hypothetical protein
VQPAIISVNDNQQNTPVVSGQRDVGFMPCPKIEHDHLHGPRAESTILLLNIGIDTRWWQNNLSPGARRCTPYRFHFPQPGVPPTITAIGQPGLGPWDNGWGQALSRLNMGRKNAKRLTAARRKPLISLAEGQGFEP